MPSSSPAPQFRPARVDFDRTQVPRHWLAGLGLQTHLINGVSMLFPVGERFFVRSVKHYIDQIDDPQLRADAKAFFHQEGNHSREHDDANQMLRDHGYSVDAFLAHFARYMKWLEARMPPAVNLAATAAAEHFTAVLAEGAFTGDLFVNAHPQMRGLLEWHAWEEIEHRSVAYDVLLRVQPSYAVRLAGLALASLTLGVFWTWGTGMLMRQDRRSGAQSAPTTPEASAFARRDQSRPGWILRRLFVRGISEYVRRDFHPRNRDMESLAHAYFARHQRQPGYH